jgi:phage host-nuclease inhibitor protein Gam
MKLLSKRPVEPQRPSLSEAMRAAEPKPPATEQLFTALEKSLIEFERREKRLETEISDRTAELENVRVAKAAALAGLAGLAGLQKQPGPNLTETLGDALEETREAGGLTDG